MPATTRSRRRAAASVSIPPYVARDRETARRTDPVVDVRRFKEYFESKYGSTHPAFHAGSYSQALDEAKKELKFLLVYLHCGDHQVIDTLLQSIPPPCFPQGGRCRGLVFFLFPSPGILPEPKPTGLWAVLSVCICLCHFVTRGVWKPADVTFGQITTYMYIL